MPNTVILIESKAGDLLKISHILLNFVLSLPNDVVREKVHTVPLMEGKSLEKTQSMILGYVMNQSEGIFIAHLEPSNAYNVYLGIRKEIKDDPSITIEKVSGKDTEGLMKVLNLAIKDHISIQEQGSWGQYTGQGNAKDVQCRIF